MLSDEMDFSLFPLLPSQTPRPQDPRYLRHTWTDDAPSPSHLSHRGVHPDMGACHCPIGHVSFGICFPSANEAFASLQERVGGGGGWKWALANAVNQIKTSYFSEWKHYQRGYEV